MKKLLVIFLVSGFTLNGFAVDVLKQSGFTGGVVVQLDCGDGSLLADIHKQQPNSLGHGLVRSEEQAAAARKILLDAKVSGKVTVSGWDGKMIPFVDNFVNLLIVASGEG